MTNNRIVLAVLLLMAVGIGDAPEARAASFWGREPDAGGQIQFFADIVNEPASIWTWDEDTITFRLDTAFRTAFPNTRIHDQIRLAFQQWDTANATANGSQFSYFRDSGSQPFGDIRSIAVHELGHILGFGHPNQADDIDRNYRPDAMGNWNTAAASGNEVMNSFINPGRYNHVLSHDELNAYDFAYGTRNLNFVEVGETDATADITITTYTNSPSNWAQGPPTGEVRNAADPAQGSRIISGVVKWNTNSSDPLGFRTLGINWDYENGSGLPVDAFEVRTRGTNNPTPLFHYDNNDFSNPFNTYSNSSVGPNFKDDLLHRWENPQGGPIPSTEVIHVGLEQDVWDWTVVSAQTVSGAIRIDAPLLGFHEWNNTIVEGDPASVGEGIFQRPERTLARGIRLIGPPVEALVSDLWIGNVDEMKLDLSQLNRKTFEELIQKELLFKIDKFQPITMSQGRDPRGDGNQDAQEGAFEDFILVLEGGREDLPKEVLDRGNFLFLDEMPGVKPGAELFLAATSRTEQAQIMTFVLLGDEPFIFDPEILKGDFNLDKGITGLDINSFIQALTNPQGYEEMTGVGTSIVGDLNGDLSLTGLDISRFVSLLTNNWPANPDLVSAGPTTPEPTTFGLLLVGGLGALGRRRTARTTA